MSDDATPPQGPPEAPVTEERWYHGALRRWKRVPRPVRASFAAVVGVTLIAIGLVLIVLPGPFTLPFVLAGTAVLASEFAWAAGVMSTGQRWTQKVFTKVQEKVPAPLLIAGTVLGIAVFIISGVWLLL